MSEVPIDTPNDAVMARPSEIAALRAWAAKAFGGSTTAKADPFLMTTDAPFSFTYDGRQSAEFLAAWARTITERQDGDRLRVTSTWTDPTTGLRVTADVTVFKRYPAVDWVLHFENTGPKDTPIIENVSACDIGLATADPGKPAVLHRLHGDACGEQSFEPYDTNIAPGQRVDMAPVGGRSSNTTAFPFFNFQSGDDGVIAAIGWSGQWKASLSRNPDATRLAAGMEQTHLVLHPGESIRTPRILLMRWSGDLTDAHNRFRRLVLFNYCPRIDGTPIRLPIALQNFDRYIRRPGWATEQGQIQSAEAAAEMGCDTYWFDAGWFPGDFPNGVGNWYCKPKEFPNGLKPLGSACDRLGLKFVLWFEPERVAPGTQIAREHPRFVLKRSGDAEGGGLFNLGAPEAREWLTNMLSSRISDWGIDIYRNDFNMDPLRYWRENDSPDRQGITEIRYIEGLYAMWDELRARHPGLWIDNCASGGRRIDIEMVMRSAPLWRSDTCCAPDRENWDQSQNCAIARYVPLFSGAAWRPDAYTTRSVATMGAACQYGYMDDGFSMALAKQTIEEIRATRKYWYGDFYPLTPVSVAPDQMIAWQLHRSDLDEGMILVFRREQSPYVAINAALRGLDAEKTYTLEFVDDDRKKTARKVSGKELMESGLELRLPKQKSSLLVIYRTNRG